MAAAAARPASRCRRSIARHKSGNRASDSQVEQTEVVHHGGQQHPYPVAGVAKSYTRLAGYQAELGTLPTDKHERREWLDWQIRRAQKRLAYLETRLASMLAAFD